ncbi:DUF892 family protein [Sphingomonas lenta]|uniref:Uncharacterized protein n=1 Tax=Sphingomonas lenta TaxID=1141887 RepID=A0A2A2SEZ2_9SPHN|nr:DUF892 family protein [Sphingomonas lenta]PAX07817.1 hypothetical protein CKY28_09320 [Sphingomonas lenta]
MTKTSSRAALLHVAIQDLHAGKAAQVERLPALAEAARDPALKALLAAEVERVREQAARLAEAGGDMGGPANLWMGGILDDAERDARTHQPGPLLDVALVGAVRKAKAAEIVSSETAVALARAEGLGAIGAAVAANRAEEVESDRALKERLGVLAGTAS